MVLDLDVMSLASNGDRSIKQRLPEIYTFKLAPVNSHYRVPKTGRL